MIQRHTISVMRLNSISRHCLFPAGLSLQLGKESPTTPFGVFDGRTFVVRTGYCGFFNSITLLWRYGFSLLRLSRTIDSTLKEFCTIYDLQESGASFRTVPEMLQAMGGNKFVTMTQVTAEEHFVNNLRLSKKLVDEMICAALKVNYGQDNRVDAFTAMVALAGMQDGSLWRVQNGNKLIPEHALDASKAVYHTANVFSVTRKEVNGKLSYTVEATDLKPSEKDSSVESSDYDVVILTSPLNLSKIQFSDFPNFIYTKAARTPYHRTVATFIKGQVNPDMFGFQDYPSNFPLDILTKDMQNPEVDFNSIGSLIPSDIPNTEVAQYCKPLTSNPTRAWKVFSNAPLTSEDKNKLFREISDEKEMDWMAAYPEYNPPEEYPPFVLDDGMFYINAIEKAASAMEMSAIGAKNVSLLAKEYILTSNKEE